MARILRRHKVEKLTRQDHNAIKEFVHEVTRRGLEATILEGADIEVARWHATMNRLYQKIDNWKEGK